MIGRRQRSEVVVSTQPGGIAVQGSATSIRLFAEQVWAIARTTDLRQVRNLATTTAAAIDWRHCQATQSPSTVWRLVLMEEPWRLQVTIKPPNCGMSLAKPS